MFHALLVLGGQIATKEELIDTVWPEADVSDGSVTTAVSKLRLVLGDQGRRIIEVIPKIGYRLGVAAERQNVVRHEIPLLGLSAGGIVPNRPQWRLLRELGTSKIGQIWLGKHDDTQELRVFKFAETGEQLGMIEREAALSRLLHGKGGDRPGFVRVLEADFNVRPYFIESHYGGISLHDWVAARGGLQRIWFEERIGIVADIARIVADAHGLGILHGDLKAAHVLVAEDASGGRVLRLVGFTAASLSTSRCLENAADPAFPSRSALGPDDRGVLTSASDIHALGMLLYQMAAGELDRPLRAGWEQDIASPLLIADISDTAARDPQRRITSASALAERLETLERRDEEARRQAAQRYETALLSARAQRNRQQRPWLILFVVSLVLGLAGTGLAGLIALRDGNEARQQATRAEAENRFLTEDLLTHAGAAGFGNAAETVIQAAQQTEGIIDTRFAQEPRIAASIHLATARSLARRSAYNAARQAFKRAIVDFEKAYGPGSPDASIVRLQEARIEALSLQAGGLDRARQLVTAARLHFASLGSRHDEAMVWLLTAEATIQLMGGDARMAHDQLRAAADLAGRHQEIFDAEQRLALRRLEAFSLLRLGDPDQAEAMLRGLLSRSLALDGPYHPNTLMIELNLAQVLAARGRPASAVEAYDRLHDAFIGSFGPVHQATLTLIEQKALALDQMGRYDEAARDQAGLYQDAVAKAGAGSFLAARSLSELAGSECRAGHAAEGVAAAEQAYGTALSGWGESNGGTQALRSVVAFCLVVGGRFSEADVLLKNLDRKAAGEFLADPSFGAQTDLSEAETALATGDVARATTLLWAPLRAFRSPSADPYYRRWTNRLLQRLTPAPIRPDGQHQVLDPKG